MELSNLLFDFKKDIINDVSTQLDTMQAQRKKDEFDAMLTKFCSHCRERKKNCTCKTIAEINAQPMPTEFKEINEDVGEVIYVAQRRPWAQRQGMSQDPLNNFGYNNNQWQGNIPPNYVPQGQNWSSNQSNQQPQYNQAYHQPPQYPEKNTQWPQQK